jgi:hypothetical protein
MDVRRLLLVFVVASPLFAAAGCKKDQEVAKPPAPSESVVPPKEAAKTPPPPLKYAPRVEVTVTDEGFVPSKIPAKAGEPLTLAITRKTERTCATEILFKGQEGKTELPMGKTVEVTYTPKQSGTVNFGCAMGMMIGGVLEVAE